MAKSNKPPLLCLHGALGSAAKLHLTLYPLSNFFELHFFDFPGHGERTSESISLANCVSETRNYIHKNRLAGATILGYSMGGYVALLLAKKYPELVGQIITVGTKIAWSPESAKHEIKMLNPPKMEEKVPRYVDHLKKWHGNDWKKVVLETADVMQELGQNQPLNTDVFQTILHPVLLCLGDGDSMVSIKETQHAANMLPFGEFCVLPNSGHPIEKVDLEELKKEIRML